MISRQAYDEASKTTPIDGEVAVNGPDSVGVSLTPRAARLTADRLNRAAGEAEAQQEAADDGEGPPVEHHAMNMEEQVREAMIAELQRQAAEGDMTFDCGEQGSVRIKGDVDLDALAMVVVGSLAGGP